MSDSTPSINVIVSAAKVLRTMHLLHLDCQLIRLNLLYLFTRNRKCPPSLRFPKGASVNKTISNDRSNG